MSAPKILIQVILTGSRILGRAFVEAYREAAAQSASRAAGGAARGAADPITRKTGMDLDEAHKILHVDKGATKESILKRYDHLFKANDPQKGGSFYIQSKIVRAKERLEMELSKETEATSSAEGGEAKQP
ncbi:mitochondrial import inner membrane translocase subunit TIM16 [Dimargaris verticillata]|uniref:Mitochondrial import inner membrane translocase subunit TIM16 n=1 Tax=Dimargaris verticillata TaxID=2761393 RepID=A0A9W8EAR3_9FUNG|nr:mitochondrial import inner membrane translocase subunit TIM16 [Dimargaris verticillata]